MPTTALQHFREDISRASNLLNHAEQMPNNSPQTKLLRDDVLRGVWMFGVGATDAYACDAYADMICALFIAKTTEKTIRIPDKLTQKILLPAFAMLNQYPQRDNWRWRVATRRMMDSQNILSLDSMQQHFNKLLRQNHKLFSNTIESWLLHRDAKQRVFGTTKYLYRQLSGNAKDTALKAMRTRFETHYQDIFQRRHDCIHNVDRPKIAIQEIGSINKIRHVLQDLDFLVARIDEHLSTEYSDYLGQELGFSRATITRVGY